MNNSPIDVIFDFDHTLVAHESTVEVLKSALQYCPQATARLARLAVIAPKALSGNASIRELLSLMSVVTHVRASHVSRYIENTISSIHPALLETFRQLREEGVGIHIISGGYKEWIVPIAREWGIAPDNVMANRFLWAGKRALLTRPSPLLSAAKGKCEIVRQWRAAGRLPGRTLIVGDGVSDYQVYARGGVDGFVCADYYVNQRLPKLTGNVLRATNPDQVYGYIKALLDDPRS